MKDAAFCPTPSRPEKRTTFTCENCAFSIIIRLEFHFLTRNVSMGRAVAAYLKVVRRRKPSSAADTRVGEHERMLFLLSLEGFGGLPREFYLILSASMCVFNGFFMRLGPDFSRFGHKDISCRVRKRMLDKNCFQTVTCLFLPFFSSACFFDIISSMSP